MKKLVKLATILLLFNLINPSYAVVDINDVPSELFKEKLDWNAKATRESIANKLLKNVNKLKWVIPHLSGEQKLQLQYRKDTFFNQIKNINNSSDVKQSLDNYNAYYNGPNFKNQVLETQIDVLIQSLNCVINSPIESKEIYCWVIVSALLMDESVWKETIDDMIEKNQLINTKFWPSFDNEPNINDTYKIFSSYGHAIIKLIILPYLATKIETNPK